MHSGLLFPVQHNISSISREGVSHRTNGALHHHHVHCNHHQHCQNNHHNTIWYSKRGYSFNIVADIQKSSPIYPNNRLWRFGAIHCRRTMGNAPIWWIISTGDLLLLLSFLPSASPDLLRWNSEQEILLIVAFGVITPQTINEELTQKKYLTVHLYRLWALSACYSSCCRLFALLKDLCAALYV